jgi:CRISPR system Cascade subunit CasE
MEHGVNPATRIQERRKMFLSCLRIEVGESGGVQTVGAKWLANRYRVHQRLCMAFPKHERLIADPDFLAPFAPADFPLLHAEADKPREAVGAIQLAQVHAPRSEGGGFLFRIDPTPGPTQIIVQSAFVPNWSYAFANFRGVLAEEPRVREFAPAFARGQRLQFRLEANPTRKVDTKSAPDGTRRHGRRIPVASVDCAEWLRRYQREGGFTIDPQEMRVACGTARVRKSADAEGGVQYFAVRFEGVLRVEDPDRFAQRLASGFGPAKAYGFGLMSVVPALP